MSRTVSNAAAIGAKESPVDIENSITICVGEMVGDFQFKKKSSKICQSDFEAVTEYVAATLSSKTKKEITSSMFSLQPPLKKILEKKWTWGELDKELGFFLAVLHPPGSDETARVAIKLSFAVVSLEPPSSELRNTIIPTTELSPGGVSKVVPKEVKGIKSAGKAPSSTATATATSASEGSKIDSQEMNLENLMSRFTELEKKHNSKFAELERSGEEQKHEIAQQKVEIAQQNVEIAQQKVKFAELERSGEEQKLEIAQQKSALSELFQQFKKINSRYGHILERKLLHLCQKKISDTFPEMRCNFPTFYDFFEHLLNEKSEFVPLPQNACSLVRYPHKLGNQVAYDILESDPNDIAEVILALQNPNLKSSYCAIFQYVFSLNPEQIVFEKDC